MLVQIVGIILVLILIVIGYLIGFSEGIKFLLNKINKVCGYETYKGVLDELHMSIIEKN